MVSFYITQGLLFTCNFNSENTVYCAHKICSTENLLKDELQNICNFMSWNCFPPKLSLKLIDQFKPPLTSNHHDTHQDNPDTDPINNVPKIWLPLPYHGKYGTYVSMQVWYVCNASMQVDH